MTIEEAKQERFFKGCTYFIEGKQVYYELMKKHHPDQGGNAEVAREIVVQWQAFLRRALMTTPDAPEEEKQAEMNRQRQGEFYKVLAAVTANINCDVEIIGNWVWCFNVNPIDTVALMTMGFTYSKKHNGWFNDCGTPSKGGRRNFYDTDDLRNLWGSRQEKTKGYL